MLCLPDLALRSSVSSDRLTNEGAQRLAWLLISTNQIQLVTSSPSDQSDSNGDSPPLKRNLNDMSEGDHDIDDENTSCNKLNPSVVRRWP